MYSIAANSGLTFRIVSWRNNPLQSSEMLDFYHICSHVTLGRVGKFLFGPILLKLFENEQI